MIRLKRLLIERPEWGASKDKLVGELVLEGTGFKTSFLLTEELNQKILDLVADELVGFAQVTSNLLKENLLENPKQILGNI